MQLMIIIHDYGMHIKVPEAKLYTYLRHTCSCYMTKDIKVNVIL